MHQTAQNKEEKRHLLVLPYPDNKGEKILKSINKFSSWILACNIKICIAYSGAKFNSKFQLKDQSK